MATYTNDQLSQMMDVLTARVMALDGIGLPQGAPKAAVPALQGRVNGLKQDVSGVTGILQQKLLQVNQLVTTLTGALKQILSLPQIP